MAKKQIKKGETSKRKRTPKKDKAEEVPVVNETVKEQEEEVVKTVEEQLQEEDAKLFAELEDLEAEKEEQLQEEEEIKEEVKREAAPDRIEPISGRVMVRCRKLGGGSLYLGNKIVKPNETFWWPEDQIPVSFKDSLEILDKVGQGDDYTEPEPDKFIVQEIDGGFFVINSKTEKLINSIPFSQKEANKIAKQLNS